MAVVGRKFCSGALMRHIRVLHSAQGSIITPMSFRVVCMGLAVFGPHLLQGFPAHSRLDRNRVPTPPSFPGW